MIHKSRLLLGIVLGLAGSVPSTFAQETASPAPYRGLFGGAGSGSTATRSANLSVSLTEAFDDNLRAEATTIQPRGGTRSGFYTAFEPTLMVNRQWHRTELNVTGGSNLRYYGDKNRMVSVGHSLGAGLSMEVAQRTTLSLSE